LNSDPKFHGLRVLEIISSLEGLHHVCLFFFRLLKLFYFYFHRSTFIQLETMSHSFYSFALCRIVCWSWKWFWLSWVFLFVFLCWFSF
jgi:hypothetical protein